MNKQTKIQFNCFSPAVMLATFCIEVFGAILLLVRYHATNASKLMVAMLLGLAIFQMAEYSVCEGSFGLSSLDWARVGFAAITALPPLGLHLGMEIAAKKKNKKLLGFAYGSGVAFAAFFLLSGRGLDAQICAGNYVIFTLYPHITPLFSLYYYGWLLTGIGLAWRWSKKLTELRHKKALQGLVFGYAAFIVPTIFANLLDPKTTEGIPSIMCGFAVILALTIMFVVAPNVLQTRKSTKV